MSRHRVTIQVRVRPGGPNYQHLPESNKRWTRWETTSRNWSKRRLTKLRRTAAYQKVGASTVFG